jgi:VanZ family protein
MVVLVGAASLTPGGDGDSAVIIDKIAHFAAYGILAAMVPWRVSDSRRVWFTIAGLVLYGLAVEWAQGAFTETRTPSVLDAAANGAGAAFGAFARRTLERGRTARTQTE